MGLFDFLRKKPEKEIAREKVALSALDSWFDTMVDEASQEIMGEFETLRSKMAEEKTKLKKSLSALEQAEIRNTNIPERMRQVMSGNREIFMQRMDSFIGQVQFPHDVVMVHSFAQSFDTTMQEFSKSVAKSHHVMQEFLPKEAGAVTVNVTEIDKIVKQSRALMERAGFDKFDGLREKIIGLQHAVKKKKENADTLLDLEKEGSEFERLVASRRMKLEDIEESGEYKEFREKEDEVLELKEEIKKEEQKFKHAFSEIEAGLRRYANLNKGDSVAQEYLKHPVKAIVDDSHLAIVETLKSLTRYIDEGSVTLKDKKKESVQKQLKEMNKSFFSHYVKRIAGFEKQINSLNAQLSKASVKNRIAHTKKELQQIEHDFSEARARMEKVLAEQKELAIESMKKTLENELFEKIKKDVHIIL